MAELKLNQNPSIADTIVFELQTPGIDGELNPENFYKVQNISIFYVERGFQGNSKQFNEKIYDPTKTQNLQQAEKQYSIDPTSENLTTLLDAKREYESSGIDNTFYYDEAQPIHMLGTVTNPAWDVANTDASLLVKVDEDDDGRSVPTFFRYYWKPDKTREGDYFICWTWIPSSLSPTETLSAHLRFWLNGNTQITTAIPSHFTKPDKYKTLLERYTPELFKLQLIDDDRTPDVVDKFNQAVAMGFTNLEDLTNQMVDLLDANAIHESLLPYLSNVFGLKLKSMDPTKWRAQIKTAVPLYKSKGTRSALNQAFSNAAMNLLDLRIPWQIVSNCTWQESFVINVEDNFSWTPRFTPLFPDGIQEAWLRRKSNNYQWESLPLGFVDLDPIYTGSEKTITSIDISSGGTTNVTCVGHGLQTDDMISISDSDSVADIDGIWTVNVLNDDEFTIESSAVTVAGTAGTFLKISSLNLKLSYIAIDFTYGVDEIRFIYRFAEPADEAAEEYLMSLPLMDNRDDYSVKYPYQNWNVRLIEETDPYFDTFVPQRHPFQGPLVYGKIRTEFPYSENVYNMEEYNGSNRDSRVPCDIDRFFLDECSACRSSCFNIDLEIENLSDDRIFEAQDVLKEFMPFHAVLNNMNFYGSVNDFTQSPIETVSLSLNNDFEEIIINNEYQYYLNRISGEFTRSDLAALDTFNPIYEISEIAVSGVFTTEITIESGHGLTNGDNVYIQGTDSDETIDGFWQITYVDENIFSIETDVVTVAGSSGTISKIDYHNIDGTGYNDDVMVYCPATRLDVIGMNADSSARMQILGPSGLAGFYVVKDPVGKTMIVELDSGVPTPQSEPIEDPMTFFELDGGDYILNDNTFTFNVFNMIADGEGLCSVNQDNIVMFGDSNNDFRLLSIKKFDEEDPLQFWKISISGTDFQVKDFLPDGRLVLGEGTPVNTLQSLVSASNITYSIKDEDGNNVSWVNNDGVTVSSSSTGAIEVYLRGRVTPGTPSELFPGIGPIINQINSSSYYFFINTTEYKIIGLKQDSINIFYIEGYNLGDLGSSVNLRINERVLTNEIGYFSYQGMKVHVDGDLETDLGIQNGANSLVPEDERVNNNRFKENFIVFIDDLPYSVTEIDGNNLDFPGKTIISLSGLRKYWRTVSGGGTEITLSIYNYSKQDVSPSPINSNLPNVSFEDIDRSGAAVYEEITLLSGLSVLSNQNEPIDQVQQVENVSFQIEFKNNEDN